MRGAYSPERHPEVQQLLASQHEWDRPPTHTHRPKKLCRTFPEDWPAPSLSRARYLRGRTPSNLASSQPGERTARAPSTPGIPAHSLAKRSIRRQTAMARFVGVPARGNF